jgi:hypothetical protein
MTHQKYFWRLLISVLWPISSVQYFLLKSNVVIYHLLNTWNKDRLSPTFSVSSRVHMIEVIPKFTEHLCKMSTSLSCISESMSVENNSHIPRVFLWNFRWLTIIFDAYLICDVKIIWYRVLNWIFNSPLIILEKHNVWIFIISLFL